MTHSGVLGFPSTSCDGGTCTIAFKCHSLAPHATVALLKVQHHFSTRNVVHRVHGCEAGWSQNYSNQSECQFQPFTQFEAEREAHGVQSFQGDTVRAISAWLLTHMYISPLQKCWSIMLQCWLCYTQPSSCLTTEHWISQSILKTKVKAPLWTKCWNTCLKPASNNRWWARSWPRASTSPQWNWWQCWESWKLHGP